MQDKPKNIILFVMSLPDEQETVRSLREYEKDFGDRDPTIYRYKTKLRMERALKTKGIMNEDRNTILFQTIEDLVNYISDFPDNRFLLKELCNLGVIIAQRTGDKEWLGEGIALLKNAEIITQDPEVASYVTKFEKHLEKL